MVGVFRGRNGQHAFGYYGRGDDATESGGQLNGELTTMGMERFRKQTHGSDMLVRGHVKQIL
jgi:hypothetical protein